ncbi:MAG: hypothetical protein ACTSPB_25155, partial [Candidatus Thorarchaeota archaeon]
MTMEIVDDFAGFDITTNNPDELRGQIKFYSPTIEDPDRRYPYVNAPRSFFDIFDSGSFVSSVPIDGHVISKFVGLNVANGNMWDNLDWSNIRQVSIWARDELGNEGTWTTLAQVEQTSEFATSLIIDGEPGDEWLFGEPPFSFTIDVGDEGSGTIVKPDPVTAYFSAVEGPDATITFDVGGNVTITTSTGTVNGEYSGNIHTLIVIMGDEFDYRTIVLGAADNQPPVINILFNGQDITNDSTTTYNDPAGYQVTVSDDSNFTATVTVDGNTYKLDQNSPTMALDVSGYGDHRIEVVAQDEGGYSTSAVATITIKDDTPPSICFKYGSIVVSPGDSFYSTNTSLTITVYASDVHRFNGTITVNGVLSGTLSSSGMNQTDKSDVNVTTDSTLTVEVVDEAGNSSNATIYIYIDSTPPNATIDLGGPATGTTTTIDGTYTATDTTYFEGARIDWQLEPAMHDYGTSKSGSLDSATPGTDNPISIDVGSGVDLSTLTATITAWDSAGNLAMDSTCASVDNVFWKVEITNVSSNVVTGNGDVTFDFLVQDAEIADATITADSTIVIDISTSSTNATYNPVVCGNQYNDYIYEKSGNATATFSLPSSTETTVIITLTATDLAGNSATTSVEIIVDNQAPTLAGTNVSYDSNSKIYLQFHESIAEPGADFNA